LASLLELSSSVGECSVEGASSPAWPSGQCSPGNLRIPRSLRCWSSASVRAFLYGRSWPRTPKLRSVHSCQLFDVFSQSALTTVSPVRSRRAILGPGSIGVAPVSIPASCGNSPLGRHSDSQIRVELAKRAAAMRELAARSRSWRHRPAIASRVRDYCAAPAISIGNRCQDRGAHSERPRSAERLAAHRRRSLTVMVLPSDTSALNRGWIVLDPAKATGERHSPGVDRLDPAFPDRPNFELTNKTLDTVGKLPVLGKFANGLKPRAKLKMAMQTRRNSSATSPRAAGTFATARAGANDRIRSRHRRRRPRHATRREAIACPTTESLHSPTFTRRLETPELAPTHERTPITASFSKILARRRPHRDPQHLHATFHRRLMQAAST